MIGLFRVSVVAAALLALLIAVACGDDESESTPAPRSTAASPAAQSTVSPTGAGQGSEASPTPQVTVTPQATLPSETPAGGTVEFSIDVDTTGNDADTIGPGGVERCVRIDVSTASFDDVSDYNVDVVVTGDTAPPLVYNLQLNWTDTSLAHVAAPGTNTLIKLPAATDLSIPPPDSDGVWDVGVVYITPGKSGIAGDGTLARIGLDINGGGGSAQGIIDFSFTPSPLTEYISTEANPHPQTLSTGQLAINQDCPQ